jgi:hypothetical protein
VRTGLAPPPETHGKDQKGGTEDQRKGAEPDSGSRDVVRRWSGACDQHAPACRVPPPQNYKAGFLRHIVTREFVSSLALRQSLRRAPNN